MKLLRYRDGPRTVPGLLDETGAIRNLSAIVPDFDPAHLDPETLEHISGTDPDRLALAPDGVALAAPVAQTRNFIAVGLNYRDHAAETGAEIPAEPVLFNKAPSCITGPYDDLVIPPGATQVDWEAELAVVIGSRAYSIDPDDALQYVARYCICHDVSERQWQGAGTGQWVKGKSSPTFGPLGPWLVTRDEIADPQQLTMSLQ